MSFTGPAVADTLSTTFSWRLALQLPALFTIFGAAAVSYCTWDKPSDVGYEDQLTLGGKTILKPESFSRRSGNKRIPKTVVCKIKKVRK